MKRVITFGTFDLFHFGHLKILQRAASFGDELFVGISSDELNFKKKSRFPIYSQNERKAIVDALKCVTYTFFEQSLEAKRDYLLEFKANVLVMGDDWQGKFDEFLDICEVIYLPRTPSISTTELIEKIRI